VQNKAMEDLITKQYTETDERSDKAWHKLQSRCACIQRPWNS
jgi:hypothetical protein